MVSLFLRNKNYHRGEPITGIDHTMNILVALTKDLPIGTNLALLQFIWMLVSGALLPQRGALFPALKASGLSDQAIRRLGPLSEVVFGKLRSC